MTPETRPGNHQETARETATGESPPGPVKRVPAHGRGRLLTGGVPGNAGGTGAPPSEIRARLRGAFAERVGVVESMVDNQALRPADRLRAIDLLARYGLGEQSGVDVEVVRAKLRETVRVLEECLPSEHRSQVLLRLKRLWNE